MKSLIDLFLEDEKPEAYASLLALASPQTVQARELKTDKLVYGEVLAQCENESPEDFTRRATNRLQETVSYFAERSPKVICELC